MLAAVREAKIYYLSFSEKQTLGQCFSSELRILSEKRADVILPWYS